MKNQPSALPDFLNELQKRIQGDLRTDEFNKVLYSTDSSIFQEMPFGVLIPKIMDDVQAAVELAAKYKIPILARTGGSSLAFPNQWNRLDIQSISVRAKFCT